MSGRELAQQVAASPKTAAAVSGVTASLGVMIDQIPNDIGKLATLVGIVLSCVLIYTHLRRGNAELKKIQLEMTILEEKEADRHKNAAARKEQGLPVRRKDEQNKAPQRTEG